MARKNPPKRGPFTAKEIEKALRLDGWEVQPGGNHPVYRHPTKRGKIPIKKAWSGIKAGDPIFNGMCRTMGVTTEQLLELLAGRKP